MTLSVENLTKSFDGKTVLDGFSHVFSEGTVTVIMGASGCGKTTLLDLLLGVIVPDSGTVNREDIRFSAVFQENRLCENLSVLSNLRLVQKGRPERRYLERELDEIGLGGCADNPVRTLSGGMKRRVTLLRALLAEYNVLIMDEPFKGLDETTRQTVMTYCLEKTAGKTVILVTHDKTEADFFAGELIEL